MKTITSIILIAITLCLSACGLNFFDDSPEPPAEEQKSALLDDTEPSTDSQSGIEIVWETPKEAVDAFVIHYGYSSNDLKSEVKVPVTELETKEDPEHGSVFRYVLGNLDPKKDIFVSLASVRQETVSPFSQVFEIKAESN